MTGNNGFLPEEEQGRIMRGVCMFCTTFVLVLLLILGLSGCFTSTGCPSTTETSPSSSVKFIYSEKATKFCEISTLLLTTLIMF